MVGRLNWLTFQPAAVDHTVLIQKSSYTCFGMADVREPLQTLEVHKDIIFAAMIFGEICNITS